MAYEEPDYVVVRSAADYELRRYAPLVVAETDVVGSFGDAGNEAFGILAGYIFGANRSPEVARGQVQSDGEGVKMAMTIPVTSTESSAGSSTRSTYSFVMPSEYSLESLPVPLDARVRIREVPERLVAVRRYSGRWSEQRYREHETMLMQSLDRDGVETDGSPLLARYNGPWTLWFLRRNEVMIPVKAESL